MTPKIVILRGKPTSGKSTAFKALRKNKRMNDFIFVDHAAIKEAFGKELGKKILFFSLKEVMPSKKNIIIEEMSRETLKKNVGKEIKKFGYNIVVFQFEVSLKTAYKRDVIRAKAGEHKKMGKKLMDKMHKMHEERFDKEGIVIDTNKLNKSQVVDLILRELKKA